MSERGVFPAVMLVAIIVAGCHRKALPPNLAGVAAGDLMPALVLDHVTRTIETAPFSTAVAIQAGPRGMVAFWADEGDGKVFSVVDSSGGGRTRFGVTGDGPGELRGASIISVDDSLLVVAGPLNRITTFRFDGTVRQQATASQVVWPAMPATDSQVVALINDRNGSQPVLVSTRTGAIESLMQRPDSFMQATFGGLVVPGVQRLPTLGRWAAGYILADGWHYQLALYGWDGVLRTVLGRTLPRITLTAARIDTTMRRAMNRPNYRRRGPGDSLRDRGVIAAEPQPYFPHTRHLGLDGDGRIWVFGIVADSGFADLFSRDRFLGRILLDCPGFESGASVSGSWLAISCGADNQAGDAGAVLKVYRIVDHAPR
jgi:hypothetical protein